MALKYFSQLPEELKNKIVQEHLKEERKKEFLERSIEASCKSFEAMLQKDSIDDDSIMEFSRFLEGFSNYVGKLHNTRCLVRWKKNVPVSVKFKVMEEQHIQLYGAVDMEDYSVEELLLPEVEDDVTYEDGRIVNCNQLDRLFRDLGINVVYITVSKYCISAPLRRYDL
ncbi:cell cycle link protein [Milk vetch chlorotic dwarf virus]|uniref:Cell cycle link protein n=1 Tax=Milk vetch chlorotic dwarf virus TaxID=2683340 RepID=A0A650FYR4_9VIRU|nr:cell cycle link protein [Milk vetch chlorotic dwarf virus]